MRYRGKAAAVLRSGVGISLTIGEYAIGQFSKNCFAPLVCLASSLARSASDGIGGPKARDTHPQRKNFKATAKLTTLQISMLPSSQPSELKVAPSNMTLRMASIKGVSGRIRR